MNSACKSTSLVVLAVWSLAACGDDKSPSSNTNNNNTPVSLTLEQIPDRIAAAMCGWIEECLGGLADAVVGPDCRTQQAAVFADKTLPGLQDAVARGTVEYNGTKAAECLAAMNNATCDDVAAGINQVSPACDEAFAGNVGLGSACYIHDECAGAAYCDNDSACPGICVTQKAEHASCAEQEECVLGLTCSTGTCEEPLGSGDVCNADAGLSCPDLYRCDAPEASANGVCRTFAELMVLDDGATCSIVGPEFCKAGYVCAVQSVSRSGLVMSCEAANTTAGAACKLAVPSQCLFGEDCITQGEDAYAGTCETLPTATEPCNANENCASGAECNTNNNTCEPVNRIGGACAENDFCRSDNCVAEVCAEPEPC